MVLRAPLLPAVESARQAASRARLRYVSDEQPGITRVAVLWARDV